MADNQEQNQELTAQELSEQMQVRLQKMQTMQEKNIEVSEGQALLWYEDYKNKTSDPVRK